MGNSIKPHIERAEKTGVCNLSKQNLSEFPEELRRVTKNLRNLDLSENKLVVIPPSIGSYAMLKTLLFNGNRIAQLPEDLGKLKKLESLTLQHNHLSVLPKSLSQLSHLRDINLSSNQLSVFPTQLCRLKNLDSVDLSHNKLSKVPDEVKDLQAIELNLNRNQISHLSDAIGSCTRLKVLRVEENCLPMTAFTPAILRDSKISLIAAEGNLFEMKPFYDMEGYEKYMERYTATKKKM